MDDGHVAVFTLTDQFPRTVSVSGYHDLTPRMGIAADVFATGRRP